MSPPLCHPNSAHASQPLHPRQHYADRIVWLSGGGVRGSGSYEELQRDSAFAELVGAHVIPEEASAGDAAREAEGEATVAGVVGAADAKAEQQHAQDDEKDAKARQLTSGEDRPSGALGLGVIARYAAAGGGVLWVCAIVFMYTIEQGSKIFTDTWLSFWVSDRFGRSLTFYLVVYAALGLFFALSTYARALTFVFGTVRVISAGRTAARLPCPTLTPTLHLRSALPSTCTMRC